jgi:X-Pro dipeptidyl-peptidase
MPRNLSRARVAAALGALAALVAAVGLVGAPAGAAPALPFVSGHETKPVYSYAHAIRESVWVDTHLDNDGDGKPDTVAVDIVRPSEAARSGIKVPVIMEASPYYTCCGRGNENQIKGYDANGVIDSVPLYYDNYFVPRGYAFVAVDLAGTNRSTGCGDVGGPEEIGSAKAVIDWLNGRTTAHYADGTAVTARWTTGKVGMIGKSWDGTIADGVAATGVPGLVTIVPVSGISSWYDYMRLDGVPRADDYPGYLGDYVNGRPAGTCDDEFDALDAAADDATGNFNDYWAQRDYVLDASKVHASVFFIHGLNDNNVFLKNFSQYWSALEAHHVPVKAWLTQEGHADPFDIRRSAWVDTLHQWFDYWLQGLDNGIMHQPKVDIERAPNQWVAQSDFPAPGAHPLRLGLGAGTEGAGTLGSGGHTSGTASLTDNPALSETTAVSDPNTVRADRLVFLSAGTGKPLHISGTPSVTLRVRVDQPDTELTAKLVDYGTGTRDDYLADGLSGIVTLSTSDCWGQSTPTDSACYFDTAEDVVTSDYGILTRGWTDAAHYQSLNRLTPLTPGKWYTVTWQLQPQDQILAAGHNLGLVLTLSDEENTTPNSTGAGVTVDLAGSSLDLPVAGPATLPRPNTAPQVSAPAVTSAAVPWAAKASPKLPR